jgi:hypothetical protein
MSHISHEFAIISQTNLPLIAFLYAPVARREISAFVMHRIGVSTCAASGALAVAALEFSS